MFFRCHGRRFRVTRMPTGVKGEAWVLEPAGKEHVEGIRPWWGARTETPATVENLALLLESATKEKVRW